MNRVTPRNWAVIVLAALACGAFWVSTSHGDSPEETALDIVAKGTSDQLVGFDLGPAVSANAPDEFGAPSVGWAGGHRYLAVTTYGSSSCPNGPIGLEADGQTVTIRTGQLYPDRDPCSADLSPFTVLLSTPATIDPGQTVTVRLDDLTIELAPNAGDAPEVLARTPDDLTPFDFGPTSSMPPVNNPQRRVDVAWVDGGRYLAFTTTGSTSCPTVPTGLRRDGASLFLTVGQASTPGIPCSDDLTATTTIVRTPTWVDPTTDTPVINEAGGVLLPAIS